MKPEQFIREYGVEKARHVLNSLPNYYTHMTDDARMFISEHNKDLDENIRKQLPNLMRLDDLKRLVESVDRVNAFGGLKDAKAVVKMGKHYKYLNAHISNYESIYGGGDE